MNPVSEFLWKKDVKNFHEMFFWHLERKRNHFLYDPTVNQINLPLHEFIFKNLRFELDEDLFMKRIEVTPRFFDYLTCQESFELKNPLLDNVWHKGFGIFSPINECGFKIAFYSCARKRFEIERKTKLLDKMVKKYGHKYEHEQNI